MLWRSATFLMAIVVVAALLAASRAEARLEPGAPGFGSVGSDPGRLSRPGDVGFTGDGQIWVADTGNGRLERFTATGALVQVVPGFVSPTGLAVGPDGAVYVADAGADRVVKLLPDGSVDPAFDQGTWPGIRDVAVDPRGDSAYVVDASSGRLQTIDPASGAALAVVEQGLNVPTGVAVDASGAIAVVEQAANDVLVRAADGTRTRFGALGAGTGDFNGPTGVGFDPYGLVVVADTGNGRIQRFTQTGFIVDDLGGLGAPAGVASDATSTFAVIDEVSSQVRFAEERLPPPIFGETANAARLQGTVTLRLGNEPSRPLVAPQQVRFGAEIDTTDGTLGLLTAKKGGGTQRATLFGGRFKLAQPASGVPTATLTGPGLGHCPSGPSSSRGAAARLPSPDPPSSPPKRTLRTRVKGHFKTNGSAASAEVKGTDYEVSDYCSGTVVRVFVGTVKVTRRSDGQSRLVSGTRARTGVLFVKRPSTRRR
ncbi:MAG: repeat containing protein [Frankiales bacterium]|nr:repeat containing protein [Frankiales bacterium]